MRVCVLIALSRRGGLDNRCGRGLGARPRSSRNPYTASSGPPTCRARKKWRTAFGRTHGDAVRPERRRREGDASARESAGAPWTGPVTGFRPAISEFYGPGRVTWKSTAVGAPITELPHAARCSPRPRSTQTRTIRRTTQPRSRRPTPFRHSLVVTFTAPKPEWAGGAEVLRLHGRLPVHLAGARQVPGSAIRRRPVDRLLVKVVARARPLAP